MCKVVEIVRCYQTSTNNYGESPAVVGQMQRMSNVVGMGTAALDSPLWKIPQHGEPHGNAEFAHTCSPYTLKCLLVVYHNIYQHFCKCFTFKKVIYLKCSHP